MMYPRFGNKYTCCEVLNWNINKATQKTALRGCNQKFPDWVDYQIYAYNNKHSLKSNTKGYDGKTH
jgi:phosphoribosylaminoimidazole carboxylase (NCAIR synthetase)